MRDQPRVALPIIRLAMGAGTLAFGAVAVVLARSRPSDVPPPPGLSWVAWGVWGTALAALAAWRLLRAPQVERGDPATLIVGWAIGEVPALFGAAYVILTGQPTLLLAGFVIYAASMALFPMPRR